MRLALAVLLVLVAAQSFAQEAEKQPAQDSGQIVALDSAIRQMGETLPQATDQTIEVLKKQGGPVVLMYYAGAVRKQKAQGIILEAIAVLSLIAGIGLCLLARRGWTSWGDDCAALAVLGIASLLAAIGLAVSGVWVLCNAEFFALQDCIGQAALLLGR